MSYPLIVAAVGAAFSPQGAAQPQLPAEQMEARRESPLNSDARAHGADQILLGAPHSDELSASLKF